MNTDQANHVDNEHFNSFDLNNQSVNTDKANDVDNEHFNSFGWNKVWTLKKVNGLRTQMPINPFTALGTL